MLQEFFNIFFKKNRTEKVRTVRYAFPLVIIASLFASLASVISENSSYISISTTAETVTQDQEFFIDVNVTTHVAVNAVDLIISYPVETLEVIGINTGESVITLWADEPYAKNGKIYLRGGTFRKGFIGEHSIARVKVRATESGSAKVFVSDTRLIAGDGSGNDISVSEEDSDREVRIAILGENSVVKGGASISLVTDINGDGDVDLGDLSDFMSAWLTRGKTFDFNNDGRMTFSDFSILLADSFFK